MKTEFSFLMCLCFIQLSAQTWDDKDYKVPSSLSVGMMDTVRIFYPEGVKMVETFGGGKRHGKHKKLDRGEAYLGRTKFDEEQRLTSHQQFLRGSYSVENDRFVGFHTETYEHRYPSEDELVIDYANTKELTKYTWFYTDSLLQECRYFQGEYPFLRAFWKWEYTEDSLISSITKFDEDTIPQYLSKYAYTDFGKVSQIQTTTVEKKMNFTIFEYNEDQKLTGRTFFKKLKKVPRDLYSIENGVFVRKSSRAVEEEKIRAVRWTYKYDEQGRLSEKSHFDKWGELDVRIVLSYTSAGRVESKSYLDGFDREKVVYYNYSDGGELTSIDYLGVSDSHPDQLYSFEYDERGNAIRCYFSDRGWRIRLDFEYEYFSE